MRIEKKNMWDGEISHVYSWDALNYIIEVDKEGNVMVRDPQGHAIHAEHLLNLVDLEKLFDHAQEVTA